MYTILAKDLLALLTFILSMVDVISHLTQHF